MEFFNLETTSEAYASAGMVMFEEWLRGGACIWCFFVADGADLHTALVGYVDVLDDEE